MVEDPTITGDALQRVVRAEVARFITDMQEFETRACEARGSSGIWRIGLKDCAILAHHLIPAESKEFPTLMRRSHPDKDSLGIV